MTDDQRMAASGVSRRSFIQTLGISAAAAAPALGTERPAGPVDAQDASSGAQAGIPVLGPDPFAVSLRVNGEDRVLWIEPGATLLEALRHELRMTGSKEVCDRGACGACSVLVDGKLTVACMMLASDAEGHAITTVEGLAQGDELDPVQTEFIRHDALQCGYCTPGLVMAARALLDANPRPTLTDIKEGLAGNLCRCGTYTNVFNAVLAASGQDPIIDGKGGAA